MSEVALNLVVIRSSDLAKSERFYKALGLHFKLERHGNGPEHYVTEIGSTVFEIYPRKRGDELTGTTRLGFRVPSVDVALAELNDVGATVISHPTTSAWGRRAVVSDPDGHRVEISE